MASERTQLNILESLRKRLDQCRVTCRAARENLLLDFATQSFNLRGNEDSEKSKEKEKGKGKLLYVSPNKRKSSEETLDTLSNQLIWLRRTLTTVDSMFTGRHADIFRQDLVNMITEIENVVHTSVANSKFPHDATPSGIYTKAVDIAAKEYKKIVGNVTISQKVTKDPQGHEYLTTFLVSRNVKVNRSTTLPTHVIAISELKVDNPSKRERYITQLPEISFTFKPKYLYGRGVQDNLKDFISVLQLVLAKDFMDKIPSPHTSDVSNELTQKIPGVAFSLITKTGALQVQFKDDADIDIATADIYKLIVSEISKSDPLFNGQVTHVDSRVGGKTYVTFAAPGSKKLTRTNILTDMLKIDTGGFVKSKPLTPVQPVRHVGEKA